MYNRYIRNDQGTYTRVSAEESGTPRPGAAVGGSPAGNPMNGPGNDFHGSPAGSPEGGPGGPPPQPSVFPPPPPPPPPEWKLPFGLTMPGKGTEGISSMLRKLLDKFHLDNVDTGDILLLIMLFFLFKEDADEELMIALGLLLIL